MYWLIVGGKWVSGFTPQTARPIQAGQGTRGKVQLYLLCTNWDLMDKIINFLCWNYLGVDKLPCLALSTFIMMSMTSDDSVALKGLGIPEEVLWIKNKSSLKCLYCQHWLSTDSAHYKGPDKCNRSWQFIEDIIKYRLVFKDVFEGFSQRSVELIRGSNTRDRHKFLHRPYNPTLVFFPRGPPPIPPTFTEI